MSNEYQLLLSKKSKKIWKLRKALCMTQSKKRLMGKHFKKEEVAAKGLRSKLICEINGTRVMLKKREE